MDMTIVSKKNAKIWMEEQEVCREYFKTEKITFGMSELPVGAVGVGIVFVKKDRRVRHAEAIDRLLHVADEEQVSPVA